MAKTVRGGGGFQSHDLFEKIISLPNLFTAWQEFRRDKIKKADVSAFAVSLEEELFLLHRILASDHYQHGKYSAFFVHDPKLRSIHKAPVIDRVLHHAIVKVLEPLFDKSFIFDSYSSRKGKGTHAAGKRFRKFAWKLSENNTKTVWVLKCDMRKFFDSVDHGLLNTSLRKTIHDERVLDLLSKIIHSFETRKGKGIPLGNLTSQLFSNVYLNPLDQFVKRTLRVKWYIRYADDFVILSTDKAYLEWMLVQIETFTRERLLLELHPNKIVFQKWHQGADFLGFIHFPYHTVIRTKTKRRIISKMNQAQKDIAEGNISKERYDRSLQSYLGRLRHCRSIRLQKKLISSFQSLPSIS